MPCLEINVPLSDNKTRKTVAEKLTEVLSETTGMPSDIFGIRFNEYEIGDVASDGKICDGIEEKPYIYFQFYGPRLKKEVKRKLIAELTRVYTECINKPKWKPVIFIHEHPYDNIGVEGKSLSDRNELFAKSEFYYDLPED